MNGILGHSGTKIKLLTKDSLYGFIFVLTIDPLMVSKLNKNDKSLVFRNFEDGKTVNKLLIKLTVCTDKEEVGYFFDGKNKQTSITSDFEKEIAIQSKLWRDSISNLTPICPAIVNTFLMNYQNEYTHQHLESIYNRGDVEIKRIMQVIKIKVNQLNGKIGLIYMQYLDGFETMNDYLYKETRSEYKDLAHTIAAFEIDRLARYGYNHGDLHKSNILINMKYHGYF